MNILIIMHYTEYVVNMQKALFPDTARKHQKEATLPKLKSLYHKTTGINPETRR